MATGDQDKKKAASKKISKKIKTNTLNLSGVDIDDTFKKVVESNLLIEDVIKQAFLRFYDTASIKHSKVKDLEQLDHLTEEYLQSYMILGYDLNGEKVSIIHAINPHDRDALVEHLRTTLLNFIGDR